MQSSCDHSQSDYVIQSAVLYTFGQTATSIGPMAENIYSKGTRVWFEDKDQAWISAELVTVTKGAADNVKLVFIDDRGKVSAITRKIFKKNMLKLLTGNHNQYHRKRYQGCKGSAPLTEPPIVRDCR